MKSTKLVLNLIHINNIYLQPACLLNKTPHFRGVTHKILTFINTS